MAREPSEEVARQFAIRGIDGVVGAPDRAVFGVAPDLATSITDGYGVAFSPAYVSLTLGSYTKGTDAVYPERDFPAPMYVVSTVTATSGATDGSSSHLFTDLFVLHGTRQPDRARIRRVRARPSYG